MTLTALAKLAHVSVSTASKAFTMSDEVNEETRELIFKVAKEHNCFRTFFKARYPKLVVGIICGEIKSLYYSTLLELIENELKKQNCEICISCSDFSKEKVNEFLTYYEKYTSVDAIILIDEPSYINKSVETPIISIGRKTVETDVNFNIEYNDCLKQVMSDFILQGITDIGFISEKNTTGKCNNFKHNLKELTGFSDEKIENSVVISDNRFGKSGYDGMEEFEKRKHIPKVIICAYDYMAYGAIRYAKDKNLRIPSDIQFVGMDNLTESEYFVPRLSSIDMSSNEIAEKVSEVLGKIIMGKPYEKNIKINAKFIKRETTK